MNLRKIWPGYRGKFLSNSAQSLEFTNEKYCIYYCIKERETVSIHWAKRLDWSVQCWSGYLNSEKRWIWSYSFIYQIDILVLIWMTGSPMTRKWLTNDKRRISGSVATLFFLWRRGRWLLCLLLRFRWDLVFRSDPIFVCSVRSREPVINHWFFLFYPGRRSGKKT